MVSSHPSLGVYLEYEDRESSRVIYVDFRYVEDVYPTDRAAIKEGVRRTSQVLARKALSFTDKETVKTSCKYSSVYTLREKDFFKSKRANEFIEWIKDCESLRKLEFLGIDEDDQVESVVQALLFLAEKRLRLLEDESFILLSDESCPSPPEEETSFPLISKEQVILLSDSSDLWTKFKKVTIACNGKRAEPAKERIRRILTSHYTSIADNFAIE